MKKAQFWDLKSIIYMVIIFVVLFYLVKGIAVYLSKSGDTNACLLSVYATSKTRGSPTDALSLECETNFMGDLNGNKDQLQQQIADLTYECWQQFGEGKFDVFEGMLGEKTGHCFICSKFNLDKKDTTLEITEEEYRTYLHDHHIGKSAKSYYDFLLDGLLFSSYDPSQKSDKPILFVHSLDFSKLDDSSTLDNVFSYVSAPLTLNFDALMDYWLTQTNIVGEQRITYNSGPYAVVYFQVSDEYWKQLWVTKSAAYLASGAVDLVDKAVFGDTLKLYQGKVPPARILITPYKGVVNLNCEELQG